MILDGKNMFYNRFRIDNDMVYSIDYFQIDFGLGLLSDNVLSLLFGSFDFEKIRYFGVLDCNSGVKHLAKYDLHWWQFGGFHVEVWPCSDSSKLVHWFLRMKFNPNKNFCNPALINVFRFLFRCGWVNGWHFSRVDYALDVQGPLSAFYVLSRKTETNYGSTRYYGVRGSSGYLRVYDKRQEQKDKLLLLQRILAIRLSVFIQEITSILLLNYLSMSPFPKQRKFLMCRRVLLSSLSFLPL